ncbi:cyclic nucleotide-gated ion channel [Stappia indica]|uniref:cyclic nucleotide-gated ion channel n=1 Tax=Stappia indica TaxID=538381 RepID=UPI001CD40AEA|nr:cyclic nucleotide-gated ion channel [Stappia indica]MCA1299963.1 cyclic nucleotide-gated ion channel/potassium channel family protein [Stappia indica]
MAADRPDQDRMDPADESAPNKRRRSISPDGAPAIKRHTYRLLELGAAGDTQGRWVNRVLALFIIGTVVMAVLETVPEVDEEWGGLFDLLEIVAGVLFLAEYLARVWVADLHPPFRRFKPLGARLRYCSQISAIIDLMAILPFLLALVLPTIELKILIVLRLTRFFKLARYSPALRSLANAVAGERHALIASLVIIFGVILVAATGLYLVERNVQPEKLGTIPGAMWWALATLTTVGYGDVVPVTAPGKILGGLVMLMGYGLFALPIGIVATAFAREIHSRDFVVTWGMVAGVPLFEDLKAAEIAEIAKLLRALSVDTGQVITRKGAEADSMYFIARGAVEVALDNSRVRLEEGDFFGEMAILGGRRRVASVFALEATQLMVLEAHDLHRLMRNQPEVARKILDEVQERARMGSLPDDIIEEEVSRAKQVVETLKEEGVGVGADLTEPELFDVETDGEEEGGEDARESEAPDEVDAAASDAKPEPPLDPQDKT